MRQSTQGGTNSGILGYVGMVRARNSRLLAIGGLVVAVVAILVVVVAVYDRSGRERLADGLSIGGVSVGGMNVDDARARLVDRIVAPRRRSLEITAGGKRYELSARQLAYHVEIEPALQEALASSRDGNMVSRSFKRISGDGIDRDVKLPARYDRRPVTALVKRITGEIDRQPVDAKVEPAATGLQEVKGHFGRKLDAGKLRWRVAAAMRNPERGSKIAAPVVQIAPKVQRKDLAKKFPSYIIVDRGSHKLRFYRNLELTHTYPIAVGQAGLETPAGLYDVQWKEENPIWRVPKSDWAGDLAGRNIPPGPENPIKARWMAFNGAAGIHGTDDVGSLGTNASHGCIRMRIPDVISLYSRSPVGTPVFVA